MKFKELVVGKSGINLRKYMPPSLSERYGHPDHFLFVDNSFRISPLDSHKSVLSANRAGDSIEHHLSQTNSWR